MPVAPHRPSTESPHDLDVLEETGRSARRNYGSGCLLAALFFAFPAMMYFGFFAVVVVEEIFVRSGWFRENLPEPALEVLQMIYTPLFWLIDQLDG